MKKEAKKKCCIDYYGYRCRHFKFINKSKKCSYCKKYKHTISKSTPKGGKLNAPFWCNEKTSLLDSFLDSFFSLFR